MTGRELADEVKENFRAWYERNFVHSRDEGGRMARFAYAGRIGRTSYARAGELDDVCAGLTRASRSDWYARPHSYERAYCDHVDPLSFDEMGFLLRNPLVAFQLALGVTDVRALRCYRRGLSHEVNRLQQRSYRARYYVRDNERRRRLAAERRKITRRTTTNPCPTPDEFLAAFERRGESVEAKVRFGGMVHDLECYVDNCLRYDENGDICGRNGGIRAWIANNLPQLNGKYKTIMRYKALAKRLRQAAEISDPVPTEAVYDGVPMPVAREGRGTRIHYAMNSHSAGDGLALRLGRVRTMLAGCGNTFAGIMREVERTAACAEGGGAEREAGNRACKDGGNAVFCHH